MNLYKKGLEALNYSYLNLISSKLIAFISVFFVVNYLDVSDYGLYSLMQASLLLIITFNFGIPKVINRFYPEYEIKKDWYVITRLIFYSFAIRLLMVSVISITIFMFRENIMIFFNISPKYEDTLFLLCLIIILQSLSHNFESILLSQLSYKFHQSTKIILQILQVSGYIYVLVKGYYIEGIVFIWVIINILSLLIFSFKTYNNLSKQSMHSKDIGFFPYRRFFRYGGFYFASIAGGMVLHHSTDLFFISYYLGNYESGVYSFAGKLSFLVISISPAFALQGILTNLFIRNYTKNNNKNDLVRLTKTYFKLLFFTTLPLLFLAGIYIDKAIIFIFKDDYLESINFMPLTSAEAFGGTIITEWYIDEKNLNERC